MSTLQIIRTAKKKNKTQKLKMSPTDNMPTVSQTHALF